MRRADRRTTHVTRPDNNAADPRLRAGVFFAFRGIMTSAMTRCGYGPRVHRPPWGAAELVTARNQQAHRAARDNALHVPRTRAATQRTRRGLINCPRRPRPSGGPLGCVPRGFFLYNGTSKPVSPLLCKRLGGPSHAKGRAEARPNRETRFISYQRVSTRISATTR